MDSKLNKMIGKVMEVTGRDYSEVVEMSVQELNDFYNEKSLLYFPFDVPLTDEEMKILHRDGIIILNNSVR